MRWPMTPAPRAWPEATPGMNWPYVEPPDASLKVRLVTTSDDSLELRKSAALPVKPKRDSSTSLRESCPCAGTLTVTLLPRAALSVFCGRRSMRTSTALALGLTMRRSVRQFVLPAPGACAAAGTVHSAAPRLRHSNAVKSRKTSRALCIWTPFDRSRAKERRFPSRKLLVAGCWLLVEPG